MSKAQSIDETGTIDLSHELVVAELFTSLQGEGLRAGRVCTFIRLAGCNLSCTWCDTTYAWQPGHVAPGAWQSLDLAAIVDHAERSGASLCEVTGGEPLLQAAVPELLVLLCDRGFEVILDTSGSVDVSGVDPRVTLALDLKCPASGQTPRMVWSNVGLLKPGRDEVKFVIADRADFEWARNVADRYDLWDRFSVIFSPVTPLDFTGDTSRWPLPAQLARWMLAERTRATLQLQLHRLLWPSALRGTDEG
jgi:7-carboxy-7-deazaguanine synthase